MSDDKVYEELCGNYRYFATWRQLAFAAGIGVSGAVFKVGVDSGFSSEAFMLAAAGNAITQLVFVWADLRTIELVKNAVLKGAELEKPHSGFFTADNVVAHKASHTWAVRTFHLASAVGLLATAIWG